jgi:hypothetical protein
MTSLLAGLRETEDLARVLDLLRQCKHTQDILAHPAPLLGHGRSVVQAACSRTCRLPPARHVPQVVYAHHSIAEGRSLRLVLRDGPQSIIRCAVPGHHSYDV